MPSRNDNRLLKPDQWREVRRLLDECLQLPEGERQKYLQSVTMNNVWLRQQVESMLASYRNEDSLFDAPLIPLKADSTYTGETHISPKVFAPEQAGKYLLLHPLGQGGMAEVFLALMQGPGTFEKLVAVKRVHSQYRQDEEVRSLFAYEARLSGKLAHANIAQVYDFFHLEGTYLLAMEFVNGLDLAAIAQQFLKKRIRVPVESAIYIAAEICKGLHYAHTRTDDKTGAPLNIIHRDISPRNVMLSFEGEVKIVDFGIAKAKDRLSQTMTGTVRGTLRYISPEVAAGKPADLEATFSRLPWFFMSCWLENSFSSRTTSRLLSNSSKNANCRRSPFPSSMSMIRSPGSLQRDCKGVPATAIKQRRTSFMIWKNIFSRSTLPLNPERSWRKYCGRNLPTR